MQDTQAAVQCLSRTLVALSMCYSSVFYVLELGGNRLQDIMLQGNQLQGLAKAASVALQLIISCSAATTQVS